MTKSGNQSPLARTLAESDPEIFDLIRHETERQNTRLAPIASENFTYKATLVAAGPSLPRR